MTAVYVLHIEPAYLHARHYIGFTEQEDVGARVEDHISGRGSPLIKAAVAAGCRVDVAHVFVGGDRTFERKLKNRADVGRWCRCCGRRLRPTPSMRRGVA